MAETALPPTFIPAAPKKADVPTVTISQVPSTPTSPSPGTTAAPVKYQIVNVKKPDGTIVKVKKPITQTSSTPVPTAGKVSKAQPKSVVATKPRVYNSAVHHPVFFTKSRVSTVADVHPAAIGHFKPNSAAAPSKSVAADSTLKNAPAPQSSPAPPPPTTAVNPTTSTHPFKPLTLTPSQANISKDDSTTETTTVKQHEGPASNPAPQANVAKDGNVTNPLAVKELVAPAVKPVPATQITVPTASKSYSPWIEIGTAFGASLAKPLIAEYMKVDTNTTHPVAPAAKPSPAITPAKTPTPAQVIPPTPESGDNLAASPAPATTPGKTTAPAQVMAPTPTSGIDLATSPTPAPSHQPSLTSQPVAKAVVSNQLASTHGTTINQPTSNSPTTVAKAVSGTQYGGGCY